MMIVMLCYISSVTRAALILSPIKNFCGVAVLSGDTLPTVGGKWSMAYCY